MKQILLILIAALALSTGAMATVPDVVEIPVFTDDIGPVLETAYSVPGDAYEAWPRSLAVAGNADYFQMDTFTYSLYDESTRAALIRLSPAPVPEVVCPMLCFSG